MNTTSPGIAEASAMLQQGRHSEAVALLTTAADTDAGAAAFLGDLYLAGHFVRRNLGEARRWFGQAANLGLDEVEPVYTALLANGAGGSGRRWHDALGRLRNTSKHDDLAARQLALISAMSIDEEGNSLQVPAKEPLSSEPRVETISGFLTSAECQYLVDRAASLMQPATVVDPRTGRWVPNPLRSGSAAGFPFVLEDPAVHAINRRIAQVTGTTYEQGEPLQVLRYRPGEEYKLHSDALPAGGEQREKTLLVLLSTDFEGGQTTFPRIGLGWRGQIGDALVFDNINANGQPEPRVWHAGQPVTRGTKLLLSKWIRSAPLIL